MTAMHFRKKPAGTLMARIEEHFTNAPEQWLTWPDMAAKFDCTEQQARKAMEALRLGGRLEWESVPTVRVKGAG